jgi:hypothetical protein
MFFVREPPLHLKIQGNFDGGFAGAIDKQAHGRDRRLRQRRDESTARGGQQPQAR